MPRGLIERRPAIVRAAFVATYPPRRGGIATFTHDLAAATGGREIVALHPPGQALPYPPEVHHRIRRDEPADYPRTARALSACVDVVSIQHDHGIWGGEEGAHVIDFVRALRVPAVATLHAIPRQPTPGQRELLTELVARTAATVVMSGAATTLLTTVYGVDPQRLDIIPYGVPDMPLVDPEAFKPALGLAGHDVILSFGLLGPGKGCDLVLDALPAVIAAHPSAVYVVVGVTHPDLVRSEAEAYRLGLQDQARRLGVTDHVMFVNRFVRRAELRRWLGAAGVVVTPYPRLDRVSSGTLSWAMGAGCAVVSTPYTCAVELLADGRGIIVPPGSPVALAASLNEVIGDHGLRAAIGRRAYEHSRRMTWPIVGAEYRRLFERVTARPPMTIRAFSMAAAGA